MTAADRALEVIDAGLQRSSEWGLEIAPEGSCWRCTVRAVAEGSDLCAPCRAFLLEDLDVDPSSTLTPEEVEAIAVFVRELLAAVKPILEAMVEVAAKILEAYRPVFERFRPLFGDSARGETESRSLVPPGRLPQVGARRFPPLPMRDLRTTEAPRSAPTPRRRRS